jgi:hypothetical protein
MNIGALNRYGSAYQRATEAYSHLRQQQKSNFCLNYFINHYHM